MLAQLVTMVGAQGAKRGPSRAPVPERAAQAPRGSPSSVALDGDDDEDGEHKRRAIHGSKEFFSVCEGCGVAPDKVFVFLILCMFCFNLFHVLFYVYIVIQIVLYVFTSLLNHC